MNSSAPFPFTSRFQNGPRRKGFAPPRKNRAPLTAPGRSEDSTVRRERGPMQEVSDASACCKNVLLKRILVIPARSAGGN